MKPLGITRGMIKPLGKRAHLVPALRAAVISGNSVWRGGRRGYGRGGCRGYGRGGCRGYGRGGGAWKHILIRVVELEACSGRQAAGGEGDDEARHRGQSEGARRGRAGDCEVVGGVDKSPFKVLVSVVAAGGLRNRDLRSNLNGKYYRRKQHKMVHRNKTKAKAAKPSSTLSTLGAKFPYAGATSNADKEMT
jgi:hypothetical protein